MAQAVHEGEYRDVVTTLFQKMQVIGVTPERVLGHRREARPCALWRACVRQTDEPIGGFNNVDSEQGVDYGEHIGDCVVITAGAIALAVAYGLDRL